MYTMLTSESVEAAVAATNSGILLCSKKLCSHCKNMEKVVEKFKAQFPDVMFLKIDSEDSPEAMTALGAERVPTVIVIKSGKAVARKPGLMNPRELAAFYSSAK